MAASAEATVALAPIVGAFGVDLEGVELKRAGRRTLVRVIIDRDGGVDLDLVAEVSAAISTALDDPDLCDLVPGPFVLEVTSPGVDRPLVEERHWRRAIGRLIDITLDDGRVVCGRLQSANAVTATVTPLESGSRPASDGDTIHEVEVELARVQRAVVRVEFGPVDT